MLLTVLRKLAAILLLLIFAFNLAGYQLLFHYLQRKNDQGLQEAFNHEQYHENDLITLRIPLQMPYGVQNTPFERVDGEITLHGVVYKYVKRRVEQGELVLLCLPDMGKMELQKGKEQFFQLTNEFSQSIPVKHSTGKGPLTFKIPLFDLPHVIIPPQVCLLLDADKRATGKHLYPRSFFNRLERPPDSKEV